MKSKFAIAIILVVCVLGVLGAIKALQFKKMMAAGKAMPAPSEAVSTVVVRAEKWQQTLGAIGSIRAVQGVNLTPEIPGVIREIHFESGSSVDKGAALVRLETSTEEAQLRSMDSQFKLAKINLSRVEKLRSDNTVSEAELDTARSTLAQLQANADAIRTAIEKKTIRAPFAGVLGLRQVDLGQYVDANTFIVSLQALSPVFADFSLPQQDLAILATEMKVRVAADTYPGRSFEGTLTAINPNLDSATRSIPLRATLENTDKLLRPGMFVRVEVLLPQNQDVLVVPATSVISAPFGDSVYIVEQQASTNKTAGSHLVVRQQFIRTGRTRGDFITVQTGLKPGQKIVSSGLFKLRNGMAVTENNSLVPPASTSPNPADS